jgi:hypothetical protein
MSARPSAQSVDVTMSLLGYLSASLGFVVAFFLLLYWLMQPSVIPNPGMAAHSAPPATRLEPLPRKMDAPELAELPEPPPSVAFAQTNTSKSEKANQDVRAPVRKRPRTVIRRDNQNPAQGYAQQWNDGYRPWGRNYRPWGGNWF